MARYKQQELESFKQIDGHYGKQFCQLDRDTQQQIIKSLTTIARDPRVPKQEREIARDRARQLKQIVK